MSDQQDFTPQPIYSPANEDAIVGALIINENLLDEIDLSPDDFYQRKDAIIYRAILDLRAAGSEITYLTLCTRLDATKELNDIGGPAHIAGLVNLTVSSLGIEDWVAVVKDKAARRRAVQIANDLARAAYRQDEPLSEAVSGIMAMLATSANPRRGAEHWSAALGRTDEIVRARALDPDFVWGIPTGMVEYDKAFGGFHNGELALFAGRPGIGKSIITTTQLPNVLSDHCPGAVYSLEMAEAALMMRSLSSEAKIYTRQLKTGKGWTQDDWDVYYQALDKLQAKPVYLSNRPGWTIQTLRADLARLKQREGVGWFVVDYTTMIKGFDTNGQKDFERAGPIVAGLKEICNDLDIAGLAVHTMHKAGISDSEPDQTSISGMVDALYPADVIMLIYQPDKLQDRIIRLKCGKGREADLMLPSFDMERAIGYPYFTDLERRLVDVNEVTQYGRGNGNGHRP